MPDSCLEPGRNTNIMFSSRNYQILILFFQDFEWFEFEVVFFNHQFFPAKGAYVCCKCVRISSNLFTISINIRLNIVISLNIGSLFLLLSLTAANKSSAIMSTHIVACLMLYRHRQVRVALCILLILPMTLLCFFFTFLNEIWFCSFVPQLLLPYFNFI